MNCDRIYPFDDCDHCHHEHCDKQFVMIKSTLFSLDTRLQTEVAKREEDDTQLSERIDELEKSSSAKHDELENKLNAEITRATNSESQLNIDIQNEKQRAETAEIDLDNSIKAEATERLQADEVINQTIANIQKQVTANTTELAKTKWTQMVIDLQ